MGKAPTHNLVVKRKGSSRFHRAGIAWKNDKGWFSIRLHPCIVLTDRDDIYINLYPRDNKKEHEPPPMSDEDDTSDHGEPPEDDDVPY